MGFAITLAQAARSDASAAYPASNLGARRSSSSDAARLAAQARADIELIRNLHRQETAAAQPCRARPGAVDEPALRAMQVGRARAAVPWFRFRARRAAVAQAIDYSRALAAAQQQEALLELQSRQGAYEQEWRALHDNDPDAVRHRLERVFLRSEFAVRIDVIEGGAVHLTLHLPGKDALPAVVPTTDHPGCATVEPLSDGLRAELYRQLVAGAVLGAVRQVLAAAPKIGRVVVVAQRSGAYDAVGHRPAERIAAAVVERRSVQLEQWSSTDAWTVLLQQALDLRLTTGIGDPTPTPAGRPA